jgi:hypothetical protein
VNESEKAREKTGERKVDIWKLLGELGTNVGLFFKV